MRPLVPSQLPPPGVVVGAVTAVLGQNDELDGIVLEASGVAEPLAIARTFTSGAMRNLVRLDGIVTVVDAEQLRAQVADEATADLVFGQIGWVDRREGGFDGPALQQAIARMPRSVFRIKGFLHDPEDPGRPPAAGPGRRDASRGPSP